MDDRREAAMNDRASNNRHPHSRKLFADTHVTVTGDRLTPVTVPSLNPETHMGLNPETLVSLNPATRMGLNRETLTHE
jgi:hypothetical protein